MRKSLAGSLFAILFLVIARQAPAATQPDASHPQKCFQIRGRAILYPGDGFFAIWHVGTHHVFYPANEASVDLLCDYMSCTSLYKSPALFADMTVCPTKPYKKGSAQPAVVKKITHYYVVPDWPPAKHK